jgi:hypothetical protein
MTCGNSVDARPTLRPVLLWIGYIDQNIFGWMEKGKGDNSNRIIFNLNNI